MKNGELISLEFSLPLPSFSSVIHCPNCGFHIHNGATLITKESFSKSILIFGCGTFLYFHYFHNEKLRSFLEVLSEKLQSCTTFVMEFFQRSHNESQDGYCQNKKSQIQPIIMSTSQINNCQVTNKIIYMEKKPKTIENTVNKIDNLLEQVKELKESVQEFSIYDFNFDRSANFRLDRRASENDLPSLEWDLEDFLQGEDATFDEISQVFQPSFDSITETDQPLVLFNINYNGIDAETLSNIVFNKNYDFKERICEKNRETNQIHESLAKIRKKLLKNQILYRSLRRNIPQVNALIEPPPYRLYKSCLRDSAYFED